MQNKIAIIGAGMSGMSCASALSDSGATVTVFDKGRAMGGRMATRRSGCLAFNHGAPSFHAKQPDFRSFIENLVARGSAQCIDHNRGLYGGSPNINKLLTPLTASVDIRQSTEIAEIGKTQHGWRLSSNKGDTFEPFDTLLICIPSPQAESLIASIAEGWTASIKGVRYNPCLTMLLGTAQAHPGLKSRSFAGHRVLELQVCQAMEDHKAGSTRSTWVVHATLEWSTKNINRERDDIASDLLLEFAKANDLTVGEPAFLKGHRWRYARVRQPLGQSCLWDERMRLGLAGDWCLGADVEDAFKSGKSLAERVIETAGSAPLV
ncbi:MAG: FAD-dependent oxidoreductase [Pseudomonadota bacterium]